MNITKITFLGTFFALCLSACTSEDFPSAESRRGSMSLSVDKLEPIATRAVETADFPVAIYSLNDNKEIVAYEKASQVPNKIQLSVGNYYAVSHTPGELQKIMKTPYYAGRDEFEIVQAINTVSTVMCRMANGKFTVRFTDDFASVFQSWDITINDGASTAIRYTRDQDGLTPEPMYMKYEDGVKELYVNFVGTTTTGNRITANNTLTKSNTDSKYDDDKEVFSGGDCIELQFAPVESTDGIISGIELNADIKFTETEGNIVVDVEDNVTEEGGEEGGDTPGGEEGGDTPGGDDSQPIILQLPQNMTVTAETPVSSGDTRIQAVNGIKSIKVKISSTSSGMEGVLAGMSSDYEGIEFLKGVEVVDNTTLIKFFNDLGKEVKIPQKGDTEYTFPIGQFFSLLLMIPGKHTFDLTVTDNDNNTKSGTLILTVEE